MFMWKWGGKWEGPFSSFFKSSIYCAGASADNGSMSVYPGDPIPIDLQEWEDLFYGPWTKSH